MADGGFRGGDEGGRWGPRYAILRGHDVVPVADMWEWARWRESHNTRVAQHRLGRCCVSTVFLGMDHGYRDGPLWFETYVFNGRNGDYMAERYVTWKEAEAGHAFAVRSERSSFRAWVHGPNGLERVLVISWNAGYVILEDGEVMPRGIVFRNRRRVPYRAATYQRRFEVHT